MEACGSRSARSSGRSIVACARRAQLILTAALLLLPQIAAAQAGSPWERAASNLERTFTGPLARSLALVAIGIGGLTFMFGEMGAKRQIAGSVFRGGLALSAAQFRIWPCSSRYASAESVMSDQPTYHPVCKSLHRPLTVCGVDRRLFFLALLMGGATFNLFYSFWAGVLMFVALYVFALWATSHDPDMLRIVIASSGIRRRYDPGKHERFEVEVTR